MKLDQITRAFRNVLARVLHMNAVWIKGCIRIRACENAEVSNSLITKNCLNFWRISYKVVV